MINLLYWPVVVICQSFSYQREEHLRAYVVFVISCYLFSHSVQKQTWVTRLLTYNFNNSSQYQLRLSLIKLLAVSYRLLFTREVKFPEVNPFWFILLFFIFSSCSSSNISPKSSNVLLLTLKSEPFSISVSFFFIISDLEDFIFLAILTSLLKSLSNQLVILN